MLTNKIRKRPGVAYPGSFILPAEATILGTQRAVLSSGLFMLITNIYGYIKDNENQPYQGAIVRAKLNASFRQDGEFYSNAEVSSFTDQFGYFELDLYPTPADGYYTIKIVYDKIVEFKVAVEQSDDPVNLFTLEDYIPSYLKPDSLDCC